jgi:hypothetical protein
MNSVLELKTLSSDKDGRSAGRGGGFGQSQTDLVQQTQR